MSIKNNSTVCNIAIADLKSQSHKFIIRICDFCGQEDEVRYRDYRRQANKRASRGLTSKDCCKKCSYMIYPSAFKDKSLSTSTRQKLSDAAKQRFSEPGATDYLKKRTGKNNPNYAGPRINSSGYIIEYRMGEEHIVHRKLYEKHYNELLDDKNIVHHIDLDKINNIPSNLFKCDDHTMHKKIHSQLECLAGDLVKKNIIIFDRSCGKYILNSDFVARCLPLSLGFEDIAIQQKENICDSRLSVDIETEIIKDVKRPIGMIASNMSTVVNADFCIQLYQLGAFGVMHRAADETHLISEINKIAANCEWTACSVGVSDKDFDLAKALINAGANIVVIDIAHGFSQSVFDMAKKIKNYSNKVKVVIGNTTNVGIFTKGLRYIDGVKLGIAQGLACETKNTAGCTEKQFSAVLKFKQISRDLGIPVISDGSIREPADFTKAIAAGANSIMAGSIFARCPESAAEIIHIDGEPKKVYAGMASRYVQEKWKGGLKPGTCPEGGVRYLPLGESVDKLLERYSGALKSGITYAGGKNIQSFQDNVEFIRIN